MNGHYDAGSGDPGGEAFSNSGSLPAEAGEAGAFGAGAGGGVGG